MPQQPKSLKDILNIVDEIEITNEFLVVLEKGDGFLLQLQYLEADVDTGKMEWQHARKWYISPYTTESEIVQTALKALITSMEHRAREKFYYKGKRVFGPHIPIDKLLELAPGEDHRG